MDPNINRVATALHDWKAREERLEKIFSASILKDPAFLKEKLSFFNHVQAKYGKSANDEEKITLRILARQRTELRDQLYPSLLRKLYHFIMQPFEDRKTLQQTGQRQESNLKELVEMMKKHGFESQSHLLPAHTGQGQKSFSIPISHYISQNEKISFNLSFNRQLDGTYRFDQYNASLQNAKDPSIQVSQIFKTDPREGVRSEQAQNLLAGRAVMKESYDPSGRLSPKWIQLDFTDKDTMGNYKTKEFLHGYGFDLDKATQSLLQKQNLSVTDKQILFEALSRGERQPLTITRGNIAKDFFIEANPQFKTVNIYDAHSKKISLNEVLGEKSVKEQIHTLSSRQDLNSHKPKRRGISI